MSVVHELPRAVQDIEHCPVPMRDGARLSARLWLPAGAEAAPVPALLEAIPYRKRYGTRLRDEPIHRYFAAHGYASIRLDLRGTGESEGTMRDEYSETEHEDLLEALRWIAAQPWCDGTVGMFGKSWGGINALQVAARGPPELRAIITVCSTDDRFGLDAHFEGGCLLNENLKWGSAFLFNNAHPPDPEIAGERWLDMWRERLEALPFFPAVWLAHQTRDAYWRRGSVAEDYGRIRVPVLAVGGWADPYCTTVLRLLESLEGPCEGWIGPWAHLYPHDGQPGPAVGFLQECLRWWGRWLGPRSGSVDPVGGGDAPGDAGEARTPRPKLRVWMQEGFPRTGTADARGGEGAGAARSAAGGLVQLGRWVAEERWPSRRISRRRQPLAADPGPLEIPWDATVGRAAGTWCPFGTAAEAPGDQAEDDARALVFDGPPLEGRLEILGRPILRLTLQSDRPRAMVAARLCEVDPDGRSRLVSYGLRNLALSDDLSATRQLEPDRWYGVEIPLRATAYAFRPGHRLRLALSSAWWPTAWPSPEPVRLVVRPEGGALDLPERAPRPDDETLPPPEPPASAPGPRYRDLEPDGFKRRLRESPDGTLEIVETDLADSGRPARWMLEDLDLAVAAGGTHRYRIDADDPLSATLDIERCATLERGAWRVGLALTTRMIASADEVHLTGRLRADLDGDPVVERSWDARVPRTSF